MKLLFSCLVISLVINQSLLFSIKFQNYLRNRQNWQSTGVTDGGKYQVWYLDRQTVGCTTANSALTTFKLNNPGNGNINYQYQCIQNASIGAPGQAIQTTFNATDGDMSANFLDRHDVKCPSGQGLVNFKMIRNDKNDKQIAYSYACAPIKTQCCKDAQNSPTDAGSNKETIYLDRQTVGNPGPKNNQVLTSFLLHSKYNPDQYYYTYSYCILENQEAIGKVNTAKAAFDAANKRYTIAQANSKKTNDDKVATEAELLTAKNAVEETNKKIGELETQIAKLKETLANQQEVVSTANNKKTSLDSNYTLAQKEELNAKNDIAVKQAELDKANASPDLKSPDCSTSTKRRNKKKKKLF